MKVYVLGNLNVDIVIGPVEDWPVWDIETIVREKALRFSGAVGNSILVFRELGTEAVPISVVGTDTFGLAILEKYRSLDVDCEFIKVKQGDTCISIGVKKSSGERSFFTFLGILETADFSELVDEQFLINDFVLLCGANLIPSMSSLKFIRKIANLSEKGGRIFFDPGWPAFIEWKDYSKVISEILQHCKIFLPNEKEFMAFNKANNIENAIEKYRSKFHVPAVVKMGAKGVLLVSENKVEKVEVVESKKLVDTVGAGDAFNAGLIHALIEGYNLKDAAFFATKVAKKWVEGSFWTSVVF